MKDRDACGHYVVVPVDPSHPLCADGAVVTKQCCGNVHDLISMTLMKGRFLLVWVEGLKGLLL